MRRAAAKLRPLARSASRRLLLALLRLRARPLPPPTGSLLVVAPHPDDETLGCGGLLLQHRRAGLPARIVFLTDGSASHSGHPTVSSATLASLRETEAREAARRLGLDHQRDTRFLGLPDGRLPRLSPAARQHAVSLLRQEIADCAAQTVLLPAWLDGSDEHQAAHELALAALASTHPAPRKIEYLVWAVYSPRHLLRVLLAATSPRYHDFPGLGSAKVHALAAHASQFSPTPPWPNPVQPRDFANAFSTEREFYLEMPT